MTNFKYLLRKKIGNSILPVMFMLWLGGCSTTPRPVAVELRENHLKELCTQFNLQMTWDSVTEVVTLEKNGMKARALVGSEVVVLGDEKISLSSPLKRSKSEIIVPGDFKRKVIDRLNERPGYAIKRFKEIMIDAGHGGKDPGAISRSGIKEKTIVLDIAERLKHNLEDQGVKVDLTRDKDEFISLKGRTELACRSNADLFVSIHANSSRNKNVDGVEVYYLRDLDVKEKRDPELKDNYRIKYRELNMAKGSPKLEKIVTDMMYTHKQAESKRLADFLSEKSTNLIDATDRGSKEAGFFVLRNTLIPAILVEVGFVTNVQEGKKLKTALYRQKIADGIAKSILDYENQE